MEAADGFEPSIKDLQSSALPLGYAALKNNLQLYYINQKPLMLKYNGAGNGTWTRDPHVGNVMLYRWATPAHIKWWWETESNCRHVDFQSTALPTELSHQIKWRRRRDSNSRSPAWQAGALNQLRYASVLFKVGNKMSKSRNMLLRITSNSTSYKNGGRNRAWTCDPLLVRQVLSQLSYSPLFI